VSNEAQFIEWIRHARLHLFLVTGGDVSWNAKRKQSSCRLTLSLIVLGYLAVYLNCNHDLSSYIAGNWWRLVMQLVPVSIFLGILVAYDPPTAVLDR
jgi:hypothetical protein